jgi:hypothetical protein
VSYDVVDLGTKKGNAISECLRVISERRLSQHYDWVSRLSDISHTKNCLGIERAEGEIYRQAVTAAGYKFRIGNLANEYVMRDLPVSKIYLAWNVLEHLPDKVISCSLVQAMLEKATDLVWLRLPSFEQDSLGEEPLRQLGLRFTWTHWSGHPTAFLIQDAKDALEDWQSRNPSKQFDIFIKPVWKIENTTSSRVVPINAPIDTTKYHPALGAKPFATFNPKLVAEWDVFLPVKQKENTCT